MASIKEVRGIFAGVEGVTDDHIDRILALIHKDTDGLRNQIDTLKSDLNNAKSNTDPDGWKAKYEAEHKRVTEMESEKERETTLAQKKQAIEKIVADSKLSESGRTKALKYFDYESLELDAKGNAKNAKAILDSIHEDWKEFVTETSQQGVATPDPDGVGTVNSKSTMSKDEIMKISDATARQKAIAENHELFGI